MILEQAQPDSVFSNFITLRDGHCRNHDRSPARDPISNNRVLTGKNPLSGSRRRLGEIGRGVGSWARFEALSQGFLRP